MSTGTTSRLGLEYPLGDDPVSNGDNLIRGLAEDLDPIVPTRKCFSGWNTVTITVPAVAAVNFDINIGGYGFTTRPMVSITPRANAYTTFAGRLNAIMRQASGTASLLQCVVFAVNTGETMNSGSLSFDLVVVGSVSNLGTAEAFAGTALTGTVVAP